MPPSPQQPNSDSLDNLKERLRAFAAARDWEQFHSPKNLAMALAGEVGELIEHFQWLTEDQSRELADETKSQVAQEMADVLNYLVRLADKLDVDLVAASHSKVDLNDHRYPVELAHGTAKKYDKL